MDPNKRENLFTYDHTSSNYTSNGVNTNFNFVHPGHYNVNVKMPPSQATVYSSTKESTDVLFPNPSPSTNVAASPARNTSNQPGRDATGWQSPMNPESCLLYSPRAASPGSHFTIFGTPPPGNRNQQNATSGQSPLLRDMFVSPGPRSSHGNQPSPKPHPPTPRPNC